jgi:hypothetical protein
MPQRKRSHEYLTLDRIFEQIMQQGCPNCGRDVGVEPCICFEDDGTVVFVCPHCGACYSGAPVATEN